MTLQRQINSTCQIYSSVINQYCYQCMILYLAVLTITLAKSAQQTLVLLKRCHWVNYSHRQIISLKTKCSVADKNLRVRVFKTSGCLYEQYGTNQVTIYLDLRALLSLRCQQSRSRQVIQSSQKNLTSLTIIHMKIKSCGFQRFKSDIFN